MRHDATSDERTVLGPILNPRPDGTVEFIATGAISSDASGRITYIGPASELSQSHSRITRRSRGVILPPFLDAHIHIPQHPIRGRFMEGIEAHPPEGRLRAGLRRNVFPAEAKCSDEAYTRAVVHSFLDDTLAKGVVGGAAYLTVHTRAAAIALEMLPETWSVGLVLMNMNCPKDLRTNEQTLEEDVRGLAERFGRRFIVTDRFAVTADSPLRQLAAKLASELGCRMQTHLNEQIAEKEFVEEVLYPDCESYTDVYRRDGLLDRNPILAHCVHMAGPEFDLIRKYPCAVAHCPTSNTLLGSGIMDLPNYVEFEIPYAICTDVGASPTTSILAEMAQFLKVHASYAFFADPSEALFRATVAPARILGLDGPLGTLEVGKPMCFIEVRAEIPFTGATAAEAIQLGLLELSPERLEEFSRGRFREPLEQLRKEGLGAGAELDLLESDTRRTAAAMEDKVLAVTLAGKEVFVRNRANESELT